MHYCKYTFAKCKKAETMVLVLKPCHRLSFMETLELEDVFPSSILTVRLELLR